MLILSKVSMFSPPRDGMVEALPKLVDAANGQLKIAEEVINLQQQQLNLQEQQVYLQEAKNDSKHQSTTLQQRYAGIPLANCHYYLICKLLPNT